MFVSPSPPKFICRNPNPQRFGDVGKLGPIRWGEQTFHDGRESFLSPCLSSLCEDTANRQPPMTWEEDSHQASDHTSGLAWLSVSRAMKNKFPLCRAASRIFVIASERDSDGMVRKVLHNRTSLPLQVLPPPLPHRATWARQCFSNKSDYETRHSLHLECHPLLSFLLFWKRILLLRITAQIPTPLWRFP